MNKDSADPLDGWSSDEARKHREVSTGIKHIANDLYGDLYFYLTDMIKALHRRVRKHVLKFKIQCATAQELGSLVPTQSYDRIEVSNIVDMAYLGLDDTLRLMQPLLKMSNPKAALIALFMNAVPTVAKQYEMSNLGKRMKDVARYLPVSIPSRDDPEFLRMSAAMDLLDPVELYFSKYVKQTDFHQSEREHGLRRRPTNTIIERFPYRLKKAFGADGYEEEFDTLLASSLAGGETYVEWELQPKTTK